VLELSKRRKAILTFALNYMKANLSDIADDATLLLDHGTLLSCAPVPTEQELESLIRQISTNGNEA
jgi:hypothetical protein